MTNDNDVAFKQHPAFVHADRAERDAINRALYTATQLKDGKALETEAYVAYGSRPRTYFNINETLLTVKVEKPKPSEKNSDKVAAFNAACLARGIQISEKRGHIFYHII
jgi:hypothetical protein